MSLCLDADLPGHVLPETAVFDDQLQPRIPLETEVVLTLLAMEPERVRFVGSAALSVGTMVLARRCV